MADNAHTPRPEVELRTQGAIYGAGMFSNSMSDVVAVVLPLWLNGLGYSTAAIGLVLGAKHILPLFFAIHGGAMIDRLGVRRVMLASAAVSLAVLPLFPLAPLLMLIVLFQMVNGFANALCWIGAQAAFGRIMYGHPDYSGPFSFALRLGSFIGPPIGGLAFDLAGVWGGIAVIMLWAAGTFAAAWFLPGSRPLPSGRQRIGLADLVPRVSDYTAAFKLVAVPAMATVLSITVFRIAASSIQDSFYPVYLASIGMPATTIGILITVSSALAAFSSLVVGRLTRVVSPLTLLILTTQGSILFIASTPLFTTLFPLMVLAALRGVCMGISQPLLLTLLVSAAERNSQGLGISLRTTANRAASAATPFTMGILAGMFGLKASFLLIGAALLGGMSYVAARAKANRAPQD